MTVFNVNNNAWETGDYPLFLGQELGHLDTVNMKYPKFYELYKLQKSIDWDENEINLEQSKQDLINCRKNDYDVTIKNLAFQSELDSVASRAIAPLLAPFVTNPELWFAIVKISDIENLHVATYNTIIRNCLKDKSEVFNEIAKNEQIVKRSEAVVRVFDELQRLGAMYTLDRNSVSRDVVMKTIIRSYVALYCLERLQFMSSFAATFAVAESGIIQGIAKLVQKIAQDELVHAAVDEEVIRILRKEEDTSKYFPEMKSEIKQIVDEVVQQELAWNEYLFSEGRSIVGLNQQLLNDWVHYNAKFVYDFFQIPFEFERLSTSPLSFMGNWLDINKFQNANMEGDNNNYALNVVVDDLEDDDKFDTDF